MPLSVWLCRKHHLSTSSRSMQILQSPNFPETFPFGPEEFQRYDETPDTSFYSQPRFVTHIDDGAIAALTKYVNTEPALYFSMHHSSCILSQCCQLHSANCNGYQAFSCLYKRLQCRYYGKVLPPSGTEDAAILDMCSSWVSHYPKGYKLGRIAGMCHIAIAYMHVAAAT